MAYYDYNYLKDNRVGIGWYDITDKIKNSTALAFTKNITEYWIQEYSNFSVSTQCDKSADKLLEWAAEQQLNYIVIIATGNNMSKRYDFARELPEWLEQNKDFKLVGHILDKQDRYYELHHQCFIVNVNWWVSAGKPIIGNEHNSDKWSAIEPIRSEENWHDDYTPRWISKGTSLRNYNGKRFGWNIIRTALETEGQIFSFNEKQRDSKYYLYPEVESDTYNKFHDVFDSLQSYSHFVANTENPPEKITDIEFNRAICTAGGITPLLTAWSANLKPGDTLQIIDVSPFALAIQKSLRDLRCNFRNFENDFKFIFFKSIDIDQVRPMFRADRNIPRMQEIINDLIETQGLGDYIDNVWPHLHVNYLNLNIFDVNRVRNMFSKYSGRNSNTLVHLTNMFHYQNSAWLYDSNSRYSIEYQMLLAMAEFGRETYYIFSNRPGKGSNWRFITPEQILADKNKYLSRVKELEILPWIKS